MDCRLICDAAGSGSWNMSVDEALLETGNPQSLAVLRFYTWDAPTLSLGYFQEHAERHTHPASECCSLVRRASGGGAILHHWELTYSYIVPVKSRFSDDPQYLYDTFHDTLIQTLAEWEIVASRHVPVTAIGISEPKTSAEPFLCFERRAIGDVICQQKKICGSAQRRGRQAVLQHGSILLQQSPFTPELPGIYELTGVMITSDELQRRWMPRLAAQLGVEFLPSQLSAKELSESARVQESKFCSDQWTLRR